MIGGKEGGHLRKIHIEFWHSDWLDTSRDGMDSTDGFSVAVPPHPWMMDFDQVEIFKSTALPIGMCYRQLWTIIIEKGQFNSSTYILIVHLKRYNFQHPLS